MNTIRFYFQVVLTSTAKTLLKKAFCEDFSSVLEDLEDCIFICYKTLHIF